MLAIVIPFYKISFFEKTLQSLSQQTEKQFKVYIGNDCSPESPDILLEKYKSLIDFDYVSFESNLGSVSLVQQWERCIAMVNNEEWIMILGDDDTLSENCVELFYKNLEEIDSLKINVVRFATIVINQNDELISKKHVHPKHEKSKDFLMRKLKGGTRSSISEFIFRKHVLLDVGIKDLPLAWYSDVLIFLEVSNFNLMFTINEAIVYFRLSGLNITSKKDDVIIKNIATFRYYFYLLNKKKAFFNSNERKILHDMLEKTFLDNKKNLFFWHQLTKLYFSNFYFKRYFIFLTKAVKSIFFKSNLFI